MSQELVLFGIVWPLFVCALLPMLPSPKELRLAEEAVPVRRRPAAGPPRHPR